ncbi:MAG: hypothetical protein ACOY0T_30815 [Myxococcota bacterium]
MLHLLKGLSLSLLERRGEIAPYSFRLVGEACDPKVFFPQDAKPDAPGEELFSIAVESLKADSAAEDIMGVVVCTSMISAADPNQTAFVAQIETPHISATFMCKYTFDAGAWKIAEPEPLKQLLVSDGMRWHPTSRQRLRR